jgi:uncharacterized protein (DUF1684 family)
MSELTEFRDGKDSYFREDHHSPLTEEQRSTFRGLNYYGERPDLRYITSLNQYEQVEVVDLQTSTGNIASYLRWGKISFETDGKEVDLTIFKDQGGDNLFLPFADATSGNETYGAGRYLDTVMQPDGHLRVDFNYAYNPYCAYNEHWSCPLTPSENRLSVAIRAGERSF